MQLDRGHVFVINGRIEDLVHDVAVIPTSSTLGLANYWRRNGAPGAERRLFDDRPADPEESTWSTHGFGRSKSNPGIWFIDVTELNPASLADRLSGLLMDVHQRAAGPERPRMLVAVPVLGIGKGGLKSRQGEAAEHLLGACTRFVAEAPVDVAIVSPEVSVFGALQHLRRTAMGAGKDALAEQRRLGEMAAHGQLALLIGAGASVPSGLPSWAQLISGLAAGDQMVLDQVEALAHSPLDQAELIAQHLAVQGDTTVRDASPLGQRVVSVLNAATNERTRPSLTHTLLAGLRCREALTTNYDDLYERAVVATGRSTPSLIPASSDDHADNWLLKMHGSLDHLDSIVLTRSDFVLFDARVKPAASVLQAVTLTRHVLMVGISLKDDNVVRLLLEVDEFRRKRGRRTRFATLLDVSADSARASLWTEQVNWLHLDGDDVAARARHLEIFLDQVSMFAFRDASWLLDQRFEHLLSAEEREVAQAVRDAHAHGRSTRHRRLRLAETGRGARRLRGSRKSR